MTALTAGWRAAAWERLVAGPWDVLVVGGGITGAGIARVAAQAGLRVALVEAGDFAFGTSSRSSKLVHGGLRYLAHGQVRVVRESVAGREALLRAAPGLVEELGFLMPVYAGAKPAAPLLAAGLLAYDLLAGRRTHRRLSNADLTLLAPRLRDEGRRGGFRYADAWTDDARLVLRVLADARAAGAVTLSYAPADGLLRGAGGSVAGAVIRDAETGETGEVRAAVVINATGAAADRLRGEVGAPPRIRPLRGSHLFLPAWRLPVAQAISVGHPADGRPVFAYPWEGVTIVGTTDVDAPEAPEAGEPAISAAEVAYLDEWIRHVFPTAGAGAADAVTSMAGVRPVIGTGKADPSAESREHVCWEESGLVTVTGGKLTTFDAIARDAVARVAARLGRPGPAPAPPLDPVGTGRGDRRLAGRLGRDLAAARAAAHPGDDERIPGSRDSWLALRWAARAEGVVHLDDLLLRRVRLGLTAPGGGADLLPRIRAIAQPELGWDDARWDEEETAYRARWRAAYAPPGGTE